MYIYYKENVTLTPSNCLPHVKKLAVFRTYVKVAFSPIVPYVLSPRLGADGSNSAGYEMNPVCGKTSGSRSTRIGAQLIISGDVE